MMSTWLRLVFVLVVTGVGLSLGCVAQADNLPYSFDFSVDAPPQIAPTVVYTDGSDIYFILPHGVEPSGAFVGNAGHQHYISVIQQPPYWVVPTLAKKVTLLTANAPIILNYAGTIPHPQLDANEALRAGDAIRLQRSITSLRSVLAGMHSKEIAKNKADQARSRRTARVIARLQAEKDSAVAAARARHPITPLPARRERNNNPVSSQGHGGRDLNKAAYVSAGHAPLSNALYTLLPQGWSWRVMEPLTPAQVVSWPAADGWRRAISGWANGVNWRLRCSYPREECVAEPGWRLQSGGTVRRTLKAWATRAGWHLIWMPKFDWTLVSSAQWYGGFPNTVRTFVLALHTQGIPIQVRFWMGNRTLVITTNSGDSDHAPASS